MNGLKKWFENVLIYCLHEDTNIDGLLESIRGSLADLSQVEPDLRSYRDWKVVWSLLQSPWISTLGKRSVGRAPRSNPFTSQEPSDKVRP